MHEFHINQKLQNNMLQYEVWWDVKTATDLRIPHVKFPKYGQTTYGQTYEDIHKTKDNLVHCWGFPDSSVIYEYKRSSLKLYHDCNQLLLLISYFKPTV